MHAGRFSSCPVQTGFDLALRAYSNPCVLHLDAGFPPQIAHGVAVLMCVCCLNADIDDHSLRGCLPRRVALEDGLPSDAAIAATRTGARQQHRRWRTPKFMVVITVDHTRYCMLVAAFL